MFLLINKIVTIDVNDTVYDNAVNVVVSVDGRNYTVGLNASGSGSLTLNLTDIKSYDVFAYFNGNNYYNALHFSWRNAASSADRSGAIARKYGMISNDVSNTETVRNVYIIDPEGIIRLILIYPMNIGRCIPEILRHNGRAFILHHIYASCTL